MKTKFIILAFFVSLAIGSYFAYPIVKERYFEAPRKEDSLPDKQKENQLPTENSDSKENSEIVTPMPVPEFDQNMKNSSDGKSFIEVSREECENECASFVENLPNLSYCQQVCGLSSSPTTPKENCENLKSLDRDYCMKDFGIKNQDFETCDKMKDKNIKTACISRITEDIIDKEIINSKLEQ